MSGGVTALVGAQFGSEGKGLIAGHIARGYGHHVRVGAANAGHTVYTQQGDPGVVMPEKHVMQQIPCAAYANPDALLYVGPGALISADILRDELELLQSWRRERGMLPAAVLVDGRAQVITPEHIRREQDTRLADRIGSTSTIAREGIGAAQAARVMREEGCVTAEEWYRDLQPRGLAIVDVPAMLHEAGQHGVDPRERRVLLEGTQGTSLSLTTGFFPYVTSRNTTAAGLCADAGVAPTRLDRVILVARTYPIRVAGNSGPFYSDSEEIDWEDIDVDGENERTTVTKLVRRVATFSLAQVRDAARLNGATEVALTFCDYLAPGIAGVHGDVKWEDFGFFEGASDLRELIHGIQIATGVKVRMLGTGPHSVVNLK